MIRVLFFVCLFRSVHLKLSYDKKAKRACVREYDIVKMTPKLCWTKYRQPNDSRCSLPQRNDILYKKYKNTKRRRRRRRRKMKMNEEEEKKRVNKQTTNEQKQNERTKKIRSNYFNKECFPTTEPSPFQKDWNSLDGKSAFVCLCVGVKDK